jgi:hypothetical protein
VVVSEKRSYAGIVMLVVKVGGVGRSCCVCECSRIDGVRLLMVDVTCCESRVTHCLHLHVRSE